MKIPINITISAQSEIDTAALAEELSRAVLLSHAGHRTDGANTDARPPSYRHRCPKCQKILKSATRGPYLCVPCGNVPNEILPGRIVAFGCEAGVGKDTAGAHLVARHGFNRIGFADPLKRAAAAVFGFTDAQLYGDKKTEIDPYWGFAPREALQRMGTEAMRREFGGDVWVRAVERIVLDGRDHVITDVRFPNEAEAVKKWGGRLVRIHRYDSVEVAKLDKKAAAHASEVSLLSWDGWDAEIANHSSIADLHYAIDQHLKMWGAL